MESPTEKRHKKRHRESEDPAGTNGRPRKRSKSERDNHVGPDAHSSAKKKDKKKKKSELLLNGSGDAPMTNGTAILEAEMDFVPESDISPKKKKNKPKR